MWYILRLFVELDKFTTRFRSLSRSVQGEVQEMITLRQPTKALYQRDLAMFIGYVFIKVDAKAIKTVNEALRNASIAEVLTMPGSRYLMPMSADEVAWLFQLMQSRPAVVSVSPASAVRAPGIGDKVRITKGAFEGLEGHVDSIAGQSMGVRVPLLRSIAIAYCTPDILEPV